MGFTQLSPKIITFIAIKMNKRVHGKVIYPIEICMHDKIYCNFHLVVESPTQKKKKKNPVYTHNYS